MIIMITAIVAIAVMLTTYAVVAGKANTCACGQIMNVCQTVGCAPAEGEVHGHHKPVRGL